MNSSKTAVTISNIIAIIQLIVGYTITILFGLTGIYSIFSHKESATVGVIIALWIIALIGVAVIVAGTKRRKSIAEFRKYVAYLSKASDGSIERLASSFGISLEMAIKNLQFMIDKKYFAHAYIDREKNFITIGNLGEDKNADAIIGSVEYVSAVCTSCGAKNRIEKGKASECAYCGCSIVESH